MSGLNWFQRLAICVGIVGVTAVLALPPKKDHFVQEDTPEMMQSLYGKSMTHNYPQTDNAKMALYLVGICIITFGFVAVGRGRA